MMCIPAPPLGVSKTSIGGGVLALSLVKYSIQFYKKKFQKKLIRFFSPPNLKIQKLKRTNKHQILTNRNRFMLRHINTIYTVIFVCIACYFSLGYAWWVFFVSLLLALMPLTTSYFWFGLPILIILYHFIFGDSTFAWLCIFCTPFHYTAFTSNLINTIKGVFEIE